ncbi:hypothetical protein Cgig2_018159 [Carnegiea gigantea]|uniref:HORMA domain-containing protein n=1 Tax=Carnegiea gigantea TaxID=171969 RepID=A0A9Q1KYR3_9CARY|nr:hypothetical protein Cgig2_018159 [Carnegiea gigantea]
MVNSLSMIVVAQKVKEAEITEQHSLLLTRNLLRIAIYNISYIRGLFPEKYFNDKSVPALEMKIKKLMPLDAESRRLIDWMEKGVYDALQKKYLRTLLFCICETIEGPMIEEYAFSFSYSDADSQEVSMNINRTGNKKQGGSFKYNSDNEITPSQMKSSACQMIRTLVQLMRTLDKMPEERTILMKLLYYDDVTPQDYEPPFFRGCTGEETHIQWTKSPLKMEVGNVNSKHFVLALKVKSVLDPCEDDNEENPDESVSLGAVSARSDDSSESGSEVNSSQEDQYIVAPAGTCSSASSCSCHISDRHVKMTPSILKEMVQPLLIFKDHKLISRKYKLYNKSIDFADDTQDPQEDEHQLSRIKDWFSSCHLQTVEITDVLANFPDISMVLIEEIMDKLVLRGFLCKTGRDSYTVNKEKDSEYEFHVKEETENQVPLNGNKAAPGSGEDYMYVKALYHALPMEYVTIPKLQSKLEGKANLSGVRKLIDKMVQDGFVEATSNRKLGKRVIRSEMTEKKLQEVKKALDFEAMDTDVDVPQNKWKHAESENTGNKADISTCGVLHSIGSDLTRMRVRSESENHQNGSFRTNQSISKSREISNTPSSKAGPVASRESIVPGNGKSRSNGITTNGNEVDGVMCSRPSQEKRSRRASMVKEPIIQYFKRQKSQAV